jgi:DNA-binding NarL/FixJ family response regulator
VPKVLILTTFDLDEYVFDALRAGASGFLLKDVTVERLFEGVRIVASGEALLSPGVTRRLISEFARLRPADGAAGAPPGEPAWVPKVLILTTFDLDEYVFDALRAGASGFLLKDATAERLFDAVRVVAAGEALLAPGVTRRLISEFARLQPQAVAGPAAAGRPGALSALTPRETEVLCLVAEGLSNTEIAGRLVVTEETVKTHVSRILAKLGLRDRTQAVVVAYESGLVVPGR